MGLMASNELAQRAVARGETFTIVADPGDLLIINTSAWWHSTYIPDTARAADGLSCSYARDIFFADDETFASDYHMRNDLFTSAFIPAGSFVINANQLKHE